MASRVAIASFLGVVSARASAAENHCDDGTHHCTDDAPICCFQGSVIAFCCDIAHPVCHVSENKCYSQFEADMLAGTEAELIQTDAIAETDVKLEADVKNCDDGTHHCADANPVCCWQGSAIAFCCDIAHPICDLDAHNCHSQFEKDVMMGDAPRVRAEEGQVEAKPEVEADAQNHCDDGTHHCTDDAPICCFQGSVIAFCCDIAHPVCHVSENKCYSQFEADMLAGSEAKLIVETDVVAETDVKLEADVKNCDDGTHHCADANPVCCWQGSAIAFCCDIAHPICDLDAHNCHSQFEMDVMMGDAPRIRAEEAQVEAKPEVEADAQNHCDDGTHHCTDDAPICCFQGSVIAFCCDIAHPVCHISENKCYSQFEADMLAGSEAKLIVETDVDAETDVKLEADVKNCDDGTHHCADANPVCCWQGSAIAFCCDIAHPICDLGNHNCHSQFEKDVMMGDTPKPRAEEVEVEATVQNHCDDGTHHCTDDHPVCCFNGSALQFCCDIAHPICDLGNHNCHSQFEKDVIIGSAPMAIATSMMV